MFLKRFEELSQSVAGCSYVLDNQEVGEEAALQAAFGMLAEVVQQGGTVYVIGNGGSAGIASHFSSDLIKSLGIPSQTLYDSNLVTCISNDIGYESVFSFPLERLLKPHDMLVAISSSGKSPNIVKAAELAVSRKVKLMTLSGFQADNPLRKLGRLNFWVNRCDYGLVETAHFFLLHTIVDLWNKNTSHKMEYVELVRESNAMQNQISGRNCGVPGKS